LFLPIYVVFLIVLMVGSRPRGIGDAPEYSAVARNLSEFIKPSLTRSQRAEDHIDFKTLTGRDFRQDTIHFWMYPAFVALPIRAARRLGLDPAIAFTAVNFVLLLGAGFCAA